MQLFFSAQRADVVGLVWQEPEIAACTVEYWVQPQNPFISNYPVFAYSVRISRRAAAGLAPAPASQTRPDLQHIARSCVKPRCAVAPQVFDTFRKPMYESANEYVLPHAIFCTVWCGIARTDGDVEMTLTCPVNCG